MDKNKIIGSLINYSKKNNSSFVVDLSDRHKASECIFNLCKESNVKTFVLSNDNIDDAPSNIEVVNFKDPVSKLIDICDSENCSAVSYYDFIEINYIRPWKKHCLIADVLPFADMFRSDIDKLYVSNLEFKEYDFEKYENILWAHSINKKYLNILSNDDPSKNRMWFALTFNQKKIIANIIENINKTNIKIRGISFEERKIL